MQILEKVNVMPLYHSYSESIAYPLFIQITPNLFVAKFTLMKLLPAKYVIEKALREDLVKKGGEVVETSSGTYALGMAIVCREFGLKAHIFSDPVIDNGLKSQLRHLGCELEIINLKDNSFQAARLKALKKYLALHPDSYWPRQYDNPDHAIAYRGFSKQILRQFGSDINLVASVGSGSSSCGTIMGLREFNPDINLYGVDTFHSVLFGLKNGKRDLRGLGNSLVPRNLKHELFDEIHWVNSQTAFEKTLSFYAKTAIFAGPTTGACYIVGEWLAKQNPAKKFLFISADSGHRYIDSVYRMSSDFAEEENSSPILAHSLSEVEKKPSNWSYINWGRRKLDEVVD